MELNRGAGTRVFAGLLAVLFLTSCTDSNPPGDSSSGSASAYVAPGNEASRLRTVRLSGTLEAVRSNRVVVPQLTGPSIRMTLTRLVPNGSRVEAGDIVAQFDPLEQLTDARESAANFEDLSYQVRQKEAENRANVERRRSELEQAKADLAKALLEVSKAEILSRVDAEQNALRAEKARAQVESLKRTQPEEALADQAALRVLELQRDRNGAAFDRAQANLERLDVRAPLGGLVALATRYSNGNMVRPQEGDQMTRNNALMSIFDPGEMLVRTSVAEPDGALLRPGLEATVYVDAYPDLALDARFVTASPVAAPALSSPVKTFMAIFRLEDTDPRLMPDLSAAVVFEARETDQTHTEESRANEPETEDVGRDDS